MKIMLKASLTSTKIVDFLRRKSSQKFIPEIDALRFFAIVPVMFAHLSQAFLEYNSNFDRGFIEANSLLRHILVQGNLGVELFFGISGFILTVPFINKKWSELGFKKYFIRRLIRIEPPYFIALTIFLFVHILLQEQSLTYLWERYVASFFYVNNLVFHDYSRILPPAWSLEIEIQFYLIMPLFLYLFKIFHSKYWRYIIYTILMYVSINLDVTPDLDLSDFMRYFLAGIIAADVYKNVPIRKHFLWDIVFVLSMPLFFYYFTDYVLRSLSLFLIIISSFNLVFLRKMITNKWITIIGGMCYSIYLLHFPLYHLLMKLFTDSLTFTDNYEFTFFIQAIIFLPLSVILITIYYILVEKPFMVLSQRFGKPKEKA